jgi:hypothetical protein
MAHLRSSVTTAFALALSLAGAAQAHAKTDPPAYGTPPPSALIGPPVAPAPPPASWYGYQLMLADVASFGLGIAAYSPGTLVAGYLGAPIIIHAVHGRTELAGLSPLMRFFLPLLGVGIGAQFKDCNAYGDECELGGMLVGGSLGLLTALIVDWSLAWTKPEVAPSIGGTRPAVPAGPTEFGSLSAGFVPSANGGTFLLGGSF